jgi:TonB family protein
MTWSAAVAVAVHVGLGTLSLAWTLDFAPLEPEEPYANRLLVLPGLGELEARGELPGTEGQSLGELAESEDETGVEEGVGLASATLEEVWDALGDRLRGRGAPLPTLAEPQDAPEDEQAVDVVSLSEGTAGSDEEDLVIGGDISAAEMLPEPDSLSLDRLSALRPELAFMSSSAWVLIRNQSEVEAFLRRSYRTGRIDGDASGSVSVTLWIDRRGSVEWAEISRSSGRPDLDEFTLALFNEVAAFRAARERGAYVSRSVTFSVNYPW